MKPTRAALLAALLTSCLLPDLARAGAAIRIPGTPLVHGRAGSAAWVGDEVVVQGETELRVYDVQGALQRTISVTGAILAVSGDRILVGDWSQVGGGQAYLVDAVAATVLLTIDNPTTDSLGLFGLDGAFLPGGELAIGEPFFADGDDLVGAIHVFDEATGALLRSLVPAAGRTYWFFAALGTDLFVTARPSTSSDAAYRVDSGTGSVLQTYPGPVAATDVAVYAGGLIVGDGAIGERRARVFDIATAATLLTTDSCGGSAELTVDRMSTGEILVGSFASVGGILCLFDPTTGAEMRRLRGRRDIGSYFGVGAAAGPIGIVAAAERGGDAFIFCGGASGCGPCESCGSDGSCVAGPNPTCTDASEKSALTITDSQLAEGDRVSWTARFGASESSDVRVAFDDPTQEPHDYTLCVFEDATPTAVVATTAPFDGTCGTKPCWTVKQKASIGPAQTFAYTDRERTPEGADRIQLRVDPRLGENRILFKGRGSNLAVPALPLQLPLRVQLEAKDAACWEASYTQAVQTPTRLRATTD